MNYTNYRFIEIREMRSIVNQEKLSLESVYKHFMENDDECIYVMNGETLIGVVCVSDWQKAYINGGGV